ncbi:MAG: DUF1249 domain-containing protein [Gammaproteobacteria bacterium]
MLADSYILPECIVRPASFGGLMTLYEANYIKFMQLVPALSQRKGEFISQRPEDCDLHLTIEQQSKYTCELRLTYLFTEEQTNGELFDPDLIVRIYYDARMAEVYSWINQHRHTVLHALNNECRSQMSERWARNIMLSKWLDYLSDRGHHFLAHCPAVSA